MARGNTSRPASALTAIARGDAPPPELEVARTPRSGTALTHRRAAAAERRAALTRPDGWDRDASVRASAEPMLNAWAGKLLGDATQSAVHDRAPR